MRTVIALGVLTFAGCLVACYPTADQMYEVSRQHPTLSDVKMLQIEDQQFTKELVDAHDANISDQHAIQTPEAAPAIEERRMAAVQQMEQILADSVEMVRGFERQNGTPFGSQASWFEAFITMLAGGGLGAGVTKLGKSRAAEELNGLRLALATKADKGESIPG